jgi:metal-responsive CopG/Arc/MetJ family transcriptional regulator
LRITVHLAKDVGESLRRLVEEKYRGRHGALSLVVEEAIREYLAKNEGKT